MDAELALDTECWLGVRSGGATPVVAVDGRVRLRVRDGGTAGDGSPTLARVAIDALLTDRLVPVLIVGEGSRRSFAMAVASLRRSWEGVTVTQLDSLEPGVNARAATMRAYQAAVLGV